VLEEHGQWEYAEYGPPPYTATTIATHIGGSVQSVARTLRGMTQDGFLVAVRDRQEVWNAIANGHIESTVTAYYSALTIERDIATAKAWHDGATARSAEAEQSILAALSGNARTVT
jgi:predicted transcriptional regulator